MATVESVVADDSGRWTITFSDPVTDTDSFPITITHSTGFTALWLKVDPYYTYTSGSTITFQGRYVGELSTGAGTPSGVIGSTSKVLVPSPLLGVTTLTGTVVLNLNSWTVGTPLPYSGTITLTVGDTSGTYTYDNTGDIPPASGDSTNPDYSDHLKQIISALNQIAVVGQDISTTLNAIALELTTQTAINASMVELAKGDGMHIIGPWEWLGMSSIVKLYEEKGVDLAALKAKVDAVPKST